MNISRLLDLSLLERDRGNVCVTVYVALAASNHMGRLLAKTHPQSGRGSQRWARSMSGPTSTSSVMALLPLYLVRIRSTFKNQVGLLAMLQRSIKLFTWMSLPDLARVHGQSHTGAPWGRLCADQQMRAPAQNREGLESNGWCQELQN